MNFPEELRYTHDHEWVRIEGDTAYVGITEFAQNELGDIVFIDIESGSGEIAINDVFGSVEAVKTVSDLFMPLTGTLIKTNQLLDANPELVNEDPYGDGWMVKIAIANSSEIAGLLSSQAYRSQIGID